MLIVGQMEKIESSITYHIDDASPTTRRILKRAIQGAFLVVAFPAGILCGFGRVQTIYTLFAQLFALLPGFIGSFSRAAFYKLTLESCSIDVVIGFGTYFSRREIVLNSNVSIGSYCIIAHAQIGARTQISSHVEIPGRSLQHTRDAYGQLSDSLDQGDYLTVGPDCWIGAAAVILANVGAHSTIGAGSVVTKDIPPGVVAVGIPAKPIKGSLPGREGSPLE